MPHTEIEDLGETHTITLYVRAEPEGETRINYEMLHMTVDCAGEPDMDHIAGVLHGVAEAIEAGDTKNLGVSQ